MPCPTTTSTLDVPAVLAAVFPVDSGDGQILVVGKRCADAVNNPTQSSEIRAVNCRQPTKTRLQAACSRLNVGGCGQAFLGDGRLLLAGAAADGSELGLGHRKCASYTAASASFTETANLGQNEEAGGGEKRLTLCTLGTGELLALDGACGKSGAERYQPLTDRWVQLPKGCSQSSTADRHLRCHLLPDGDLFIPSPFASNGYCTRMDPWTGIAQTAAVYLPDPGYWAGDLPSVLLPLVPGNNHMPRILVCGQYPSQLLDFNYPTWHWQAVPRAGPMAMVRRPGSCATLLPTGQVLLTGGKAAVPIQTELYHPPFNAATQSHNYGTGSWETLQSTPIAPNDQSDGCLALLMPDGRVWTSSGSASDPKVEIIQPPYPDGSRPWISACPELISYGEKFAIEVAPAEGVGNVVLMRCGSSTCSSPAANPDQRSIWLQFTRTTGDGVEATAPPNGHVAPPGNYMLFVIDTSGRPCEYAKFVRVGGGAVSIYTAQNTVTSSDVQPPCEMPGALSVVLDGVATKDLGCPGRPFPPNIELRYADNNTVVPGVSCRLAATLLESPNAAATTPQRITLEFNLCFADMAAFDGVPAGSKRPVRIDAVCGGCRSSASFDLIKTPSVSTYFLKSGADFDLRLLRLPRGETWAGLTNNDPVKFVQGAVQALRGNPSRTDHPFDQLSLDSTVELAAAVGGVEVNNFAFARLRCRAPTGARADDVKVFFRLFNPSGAGMLYDRQTSYSRTTDGRNAGATVGKVHGEVVSMPFFADERPPGDDLGGHVDPTNTCSLVGRGEDEEVVAYFGCWLDFNVNPKVREAIIRSSHQCMVAEVHHPPNPIDKGASPFACDRLIQRNLSIVASDNPGPPAAHTVCLPFELSPESYDAAPPPFPDIKTTVSQRAAYKVDELLVNWHNLPQDAYATIYFPALDVGKLVDLAAALKGGSGFLSLLDKHTVLFRVGHASYLPLIFPSPDPITGLLTVQMPPTVRSGSTYHVSLHQISGRKGTVVGTFELTIPVGNAEDLVDQAGGELGVVKGLTPPAPSGGKKADRWASVSKKYTQGLEDRVRAFGGDPEPYRGLFISTSAKGGIDGGVYFVRYDRSANQLDGHEIRVDSIKKEQQKPVDLWYSYASYRTVYLIPSSRPRVGLSSVEDTAGIQVEPLTVEGGRGFAARLKTLLNTTPVAGFKGLVSEFSQAGKSDKVDGVKALQVGEVVFQGLPNRLMCKGEAWLGPLPRTTYTPTDKKPFRGIWAVDYGNGTELLLLCQPDDEGGSESVYEGPLVAIKLTSCDAHVPQGEVSWQVADLSKAGQVNVEHETRYSAERMVQCQVRGADKYHQHGPSNFIDGQLYVISTDKLAVYRMGPYTGAWCAGGIYYCHRVDVGWFLG